MGANTGYCTRSLGFQGDFVTEPLTSFVDKGVGGGFLWELVRENLDDIGFFGGVNDEENDPRQRFEGFTDQNFLVPLFFKPEVGELVPFVEFLIGQNT